MRSLSHHEPGEVMVGDDAQGRLEVVQESEAQTLRPVLEVLCRFVQAPAVPPGDNETSSPKAGAEPTQHFVAVKGLDLAAIDLRSSSLRLVDPSLLDLSARLSLSRR